VAKAADSIGLGEMHLKALGERAALVFESRVSRDGQGRHAVGALAAKIVLPEPGPP
jgi:hypothetical protein